MNDLEERVGLYNKVFPRYPKLCYDKGWLYGVWYCPRSFQKQTYYGQYPLTYIYFRELWRQKTGRLLLILTRL